MDSNEFKKRLIWFVIGALVVVAFPSLAKGEWPKPVFYIFSGLFLALAGYGIVTGRVYFKNPHEIKNKGWCSRVEEPLYYWLGIGIYAFAAASILWCLR